MKLARIFPFIVALAFTASPARAVPMLVQLTDLMKADTIVIAKVHGSSASGVDLDVERAIRGTASGAFHATMPEPGAASPYAAGTRLVAFVSHGVWTAVALAGTGTLETSVLHFEALPVCCDATGIAPAIATLTQIESAVRGSPLAWTFRGNLELAGARSTIDIEVQSPSNVVRGLPAMAGYAPPIIQVGYGMKGAVTLTYNVTTRRAAPLRIIAEATGSKNPDGSIAVTYRVFDPAGVNERDFRRFVADATLAHP